MSVDLGYRLDSAEFDDVGFDLINGSLSGADSDVFTNVTFDVGETSKTITLTTNVDSTPDNEALTIFLVDPPIARLGNPSEMDVTILDFTDRELSIADELVLEGNPAQFVVSLNEPSLEQVTVQYTTNSGSGSFVPTSGMLTFEIGDLSKTIEVTTLDNAPDRNDETFFVDLSAPTNGVIVDSQGAGTILKKGRPPTYQAIESVRRFRSTWFPIKSTRSKKPLVTESTETMTSICLP